MPHHITAQHTRIRVHPSHNTAQPSHKHDSSQPIPAQSIAFQPSPSHSSPSHRIPSQLNPTQPNPTHPSPTIQNTHLFLPSYYVDVEVFFLHAYAKIRENGWQHCFATEFGCFLWASGNTWGEKEVEGSLTVSENIWFYVAVLGCFGQNALLLGRTTIEYLGLFSGF